MSELSQYEKSRMLARSVFDGMLMQTRIFGLVAMVALCLSVWSFVRLETMVADVKPYVVQLDGFGMVVQHGEIAKELVVEDQVTRVLIREFVGAMRRVSSDERLQARLYQSVRFYVEGASLAKYHEMFDADKRLGGWSRDVVVRTIVPLDRDGVWEVVWVEKEYRGELISARQFKGVLSIDYRPSRGGESQEMNPLGFTVLDFYVDEDFSQRKTHRIGEE